MASPWASSPAEPSVGSRCRRISASMFPPSSINAEPMGLLPTTRLFARIDAAVATAFIQTWRLKYDVGFWRPVQAVAVGATDGNDDRGTAGGDLGRHLLASELLEEDAVGRRGASGEGRHHERRGGGERGRRGEGPERAWLRPDHGREFTGHAAAPVRPEARDIAVCARVVWDS